MFSRRHTVCVFTAVLVSEKADVNITALYFIQIDFVRTAIFRRQILEKENVGHKPM